MDNIKKIVSQYLDIENNRLAGDGYTHKQEYSALLELETKTHSLMRKGKTEEVRHLAYLLHKNIKMATEKRLIDANELTDRLNHTVMVAHPNLFPGLLAAVKVVDDSPTVDAVEVVHGRWDTDEFGIFCTACKEYTVDYERTNYCHNCGAQMDVIGG